MSLTTERKRDAWSERFERFSTSDLAIARFCSTEQVPVASFYYWRKKLGREDLRRRATRTLSGAQQSARPCRSIPQSRSKPQQSFAESGSFRTVSVVHAPLRAAANVAIYLPGGIRIEVSADDGDAIGTVIAAVRRTQPVAVDTRRSEPGCREPARCEPGSGIASG